METNFTDKGGMALAEALTVNTALRRIRLSVLDASYMHNTAKFGAPTYDAFLAMLRVNTRLVLDLSLSNDVGSGNRKIVDYRNRMRIEQSLNQLVAEDYYHRVR
jgi:hypothetical protein